MQGSSRGPRAGSQWVPRSRGGRLRWALGLRCSCPFVPRANSLGKDGAPHPDTGDRPSRTPLGRRPRGLWTWSVRAAAVVPAAPASAGSPRRRLPGCRPWAASSPRFPHCRGRTPALCSPPLCLPSSGHSLVPVDAPVKVLPPFLHWSPSDFQSPVL